jgi:non-specific serine/threonine protein kinase
MPPAPGSSADRGEDARRLSGLASLREAVRSLTAGAIYSAGGKDRVLAAVSRLKTPGLARAAWEGSVCRLSLLLDRNAVSVGLDGLRPITVCSCAAWTPGNLCHHGVMALLLLKKALVPDALGQVWINTLDLTLLREVLAGAGEPTVTQEPAASAAASPLPPGWHLLLERTPKGTTLSPAFRGAPVNARSPSVPPDLTRFMHHLLTRRDDPALLPSPLPNGDLAPLLYRDATHQRLVTPRVGPPRRLSIRCDLAADRVEVGLFLDDQRSIGQVIPLTPFLLVDLERGSLERLEPGPVTALWHQVRAQLHGAPDLEGSGDGIPTESFAGLRTEFNRLRVAPVRGTEPIPPFLGFTRDGAPATPSPAAPGRHRLRIHGEDLRAGWVSLSGELEIEGEVVPLTSSPFRHFTEDQTRFSSTRGIKRRQHLFGIFMTAAAEPSPDDRDRIIRQGLNHPLFSRYALRKEAREFLKRCLAMVQEEETVLLAATPGWRTALLSRQRDLELLSIPWRVLGPEAVSPGPATGVLSVPAPLLAERLEILHRELGNHGFSLVHHREEVVPRTWDFSLEVTSTGLDWFELRPEIRGEDGVIGEEDIAAALAGGGIFRRGDRLVVLDASSRRALAALAAIGRESPEAVVRIPRLHILDWLDLRREGVRVLLPPEDERILSSLLSFAKIPPKPLPQELRGHLRHYQEEGYRWLAFLYEHRLGGCLADDMGLGKTIQAISLLAGLREGKIAARGPGGRPHLVVVPPSLLFNWESEIRRFYPEFRVTLYRGSDRNADFSGSDIVLASYAIVRKDLERLVETDFHVIVFDEAQLVKNLRAQATGAARSLRGEFKVALTGTPVENHPGEYYSIMDLVVPGLLDPAAWGTRKAKYQTAHLDLMVRRTRPFVLRRTKALIAHELPPKTESDIYLDLAPRQRALYQRTVTEVAETVHQAFRAKSAGQARIIALTAILKLRQICLSTRLLIPGSERSPKVDFLVEQLLELRDEGHAALVFSQFTSFLDLVEPVLREARLAFLRLDGSTPQAKRRTVVENFQDPAGPPVFLISLKAGGKGLNLTRASYVYHLDPWWNPAVEDQASDRAHRIGQIRPVTVTRLLMRHTIEEKMMLLKERKTRLYRALLDEGHTGRGVDLTREDFDFLIGPG